MHDSATILTRFNRLMRDLERGESSRNTFEPWEIELLLDLEACALAAPVQKKLLDRYRRAVERGLTAGDGTPLKFSEYLSTKAGATEVPSRYP